MSNVQDVIKLYLYDLEVSDDLFRRFLLEAVEKDGAGNPAALRALDSLYAMHSVRV